MPLEQIFLKNLEQRFMEKVELIPFHSCWEWMANRNRNGYGVFGVSGQLKKAHRVSFELFKGEVDGHQVLHKCDNPGCVNPDHLILGTHLQNMRDMVRKKRHSNSRKTHCKKGHEFTPENTVVYGTRRHCLACRYDN